MNGKHMSNPLQIFLDGLDASTDGRGYDAEHERARMLLEAAPDLLKACEAPELGQIFEMLNAYASGDTMKYWCRVDPVALLAHVYQGLAVVYQRNQAAIAKARGE